MLGLAGGVAGAPDARAGRGPVACRPGRRARLRAACRGPRLLPSCGGWPAPAARAYACFARHRAMRRTQRIGMGDDPPARACPDAGSPRSCPARPARRGGARRLPVPTCGFAARTGSPSTTAPTTAAVVQHRADLGREKRLSRLGIERYGYTRAEIVDGAGTSSATPRTHSGCQHDRLGSEAGWASSGCPASADRDARGCRSAAPVPHAPDPPRSTQGAARPRVAQK